MAVRGYVSGFVESVKNWEKRMLFTVWSGFVGDNYQKFTLFDQYICANCTKNLKNSYYSICAICTKCAINSIIICAILLNGVESLVGSALLFVQNY